MKRLLALAGLGALIAVLGAFAAVALADAPPKVFVCKYVGTPGVDERLQTGDNPISVSASSIKEWDGQNPGNLIGLEFADRHGKSVVIAIDTGQTEPNVSACPGPIGPPEGKGALVVVKVVVNDDGGTKVASDFSFTVDGQSYPFEADGSNSFVLDPGKYTVGEIAADGYKSSGGGKVDVVAGESTTVTITNDDVKVPPPHVVTGDAAVSCILPEGIYRVSGTVDGHTADQVDPATIPGHTKGSTQVTVTRGDTSVRTTVSTNGDCGNAPTPPVVIPPAVVTPPPAETTPATVPTAPLTPPTTTTKPAKPKPAATPAAKTAAPKKAVAGAYVEKKPTLAYTP